MFCKIVTWGFRSVKSVLETAFAFRRFNVVFAALPYDINLESYLETTWQWLLWCLICRGGPSSHTQTHNSRDETALWFKTKDKREPWQLMLDEWWRNVKQVGFSLPIWYRLPQLWKQMKPPDCGAKPTGHYLGCTFYPRWALIRFPTPLVLFSSIYIYSLCIRGLPQFHACVYVNLKNTSEVTWEETTMTLSRFRWEFEAFLREQKIHLLTQKKKYHNVRVGNKSPWHRWHSSPVLAPTSVEPASLSVWDQALFLVMEQGVRYKGSAEAARKPGRGNG